MTTFSVTERETYKRCRRKWRYASMNHQRLEPVIKSPAFVTGTLIHKVLPDWCAGIDPNESIIKYSAEVLVDIVTHYIEDVGCGPSPEELAPIKDAIGLAGAMIQRYVEYYKTPLQDGMRLLAAEQTFTIDVPGTEHKLEGTLDGVLADEFDNIYVLEHKTFGRRPHDLDLSTNDQFLAYMWLLNKSGFGARVRGLCYNGLFKRAEIPQGKKIQDMFIRKLLMRSQEELDEFTVLLAEELNEMASITRPSQFYKNVPWDGCWDCAFRQLCITESVGGDTSYLIKARYTQRKDYYNRDLEC